MRFSERTFPSIGVSFALAGLVLAATFAIWAALDEVIAATFALIATVLAILWWRSAIHRVEFDGKWLRVNDARVEVRYISRCAGLDHEDWSRRRGVDFDPALFHAHRFWSKSGVELTLDDPRDPHTGWLFGCRDYERLEGVITDALHRN